MTWLFGNTGAETVTAIGDTFSRVAFYRQLKSHTGIALRDLVCEHIMTTLQLNIIQVDVLEYRMSSATMIFCRKPRRNFRIRITLAKPRCKQFIITPVRHLTILSKAISYNIQIPVTLGYASFAKGNKGCRTPNIQAYTGREPLLDTMIICPTFIENELNGDIDLDKYPEKAIKYLSGIGSKYKKAKDILLMRKTTNAKKTKFDLLRAFPITVIHEVILDPRPALVWS
ncbi:hypothetical protein F5884DRAFT_470797 [Xylogone sp. PMI_703]|nr:hypothetical protein F5884DRAFT_470797 [Xylogone sp. PMI_703]